MDFLISGLGLAYIYFGYKFAKEILLKAGIDEDDDAFELGITFVGIAITWPLFAFASVMYGVFAVIGKRIKTKEK